MYYEIYLDVVFIINFILDFIIVKITGCILKRKSTFLRCITAAAISSCVLCVAYILFMEMLVRYYFIMMLIMNLITVILVFYHRKCKVCEIIRALVIYYMVSFLLGGIINMICIKAYDGALFNVSWWSVLIVGGISFIAIKPLVLCIDRRREKESIYCDVELEMGGNKIRVKGLLDTGNHLMEPLSRKPVQVAELSAVEGGFSKDFVSAVKRYYESGIIDNGLYMEKSIRMVPFRAVGTPGDKFLIAVMADIMKVKNELVEYADKDVYIALYNGRLAGDGSYRILLHSKELMRERG